MFTHLKRRLGVLAAVAVLGALVPVMSSSPVSAAPATTAVTALTLSDGAAFKACPTSAAVPSAGFTDTTDTAVDCLKYYGITSGTTDTTFDPTGSVTRWQMALFITRALDVANTALPTGADQGFTDISGKSAEHQLAINQLKQLGITVGTDTAGVIYSPDTNVTRAQMALFLERTADNLTAGPGGTSEADAALTTDASITYINSNCGEGAGVKTCTGLYNYADVDSGSITVDASLAAKELFVMGIHDGYGTTFDPTADMTRAAMATFLNALLDHSNLRPEGLHLQLSAYAALGGATPGLSVSYRDASFDPIADAPVDVHYWRYTTTEGNAQFTATGICDDSVGVTGSVTKCYIDANEPTTNEAGNVGSAGSYLTAAVGTPYATVYDGTDTYHAWTNAVGTTYDNDLHGEAGTATDAANKHSSIAYVASPAASEFRCSVDTPANADTTTAAVTMKFAAVSTVTCQMTNGTSATSGAVPAAGLYVRMDRSRTYTADDTGAQTGKVIESESAVAISGADGSVSWTITGPADTSGTDNITDAVTITRITGGSTGMNAGGGLPTTGNSGFMTDTSGVLTFSLDYFDTAAVTKSVAMTQNVTSAAAAATGVARSVTATAYDQYGDGKAGEVITFNSSASLPNSLGMICTLVTPTVCTSNLAHGLAVGDSFMIYELGAGVGYATQITPGTGSDVALIGDPGTLATNSIVKVKTVESTTTITLESATSSLYNIALSTASSAASPLILRGQTFADTGNTRTTASTGAATYSWTDTWSTSGVDTISATADDAAGDPTVAANYYRLATAADFTLANGTLTTTGITADCDGDNDIVMSIVEFNAADDNFIGMVRDCVTGTLVDTMVTDVFMKYSYDSNDQFACGAAIPGTARSMAVWEGTTAAYNCPGYLAAGLATATAAQKLTLGHGGAFNEITGIDYEALSTGISRFYGGA